MKANIEKGKSLTEAKLEIKKMISDLHAALENNHSIFRIEIKYGANEGLEFKAVVDSELKSEECMMLVFQYQYEESEKQMVPKHYKVFATGEENDDGWLQSYEDYDSLESGFSKYG